MGDPEVQGETTTEVQADASVQSEPGKTIERDLSKSTAHLRCILTNDEKMKLSEEMSHALDEKQTLENELSSLSKEFKAKIAEKEALIYKTASIFRQGYEYREVDIEIDRDYRLGKVTKTRMDTFEVFEERPMTGAERQQKLL
jgi:hypothetical protein